MKTRVKASNEAALRRDAVRAIMPQLRELETAVLSEMRGLVRVDTGDLRESLRSELDEATGKLTFGTASDHALAQEHGRPDIPAYGWTPYFRPVLFKYFKPRAGGATR